MWTLTDHNAYILKKKKYKRRIKWIKIFYDFYCQIDQLILNTQFDALSLFSSPNNYLHLVFQKKNFSITSKIAMQFLKTLWLDIDIRTCHLVVFVSIFIRWWRSFNQRRKYSCISFWFVQLLTQFDYLTSLHFHIFSLERRICYQLPCTRIYTHIIDADKPAKSSGVDVNSMLSLQCSAHSSQLIAHTLSNRTAATQ